MSISITKRRDACLRFLRSDFDIDGTVAWVMREYMDDPSMERAKNKGKLARNIVTIGGSGDQQALNMVAFQQALAVLADEQRRKAVKAHTDETSALRGQNAALQERLHEIEAELRDRTDRLYDQQEKFHGVEKERLQALATSAGSESA